MTLFTIIRLATGPIAANTAGAYRRERKMERPVSITIFGDTEEGESIVTALLAVV